MTSHDWHALAEQERARLLMALGVVSAGGLVENVQHIGATSVPGLPAQPCVDLALAIYPFPLDADRLAALGYALLPTSTEFEQRAQHTAGRFALFICEVGSDEWTSYLLIRDYLRANANARRQYSAYKAAGRAEGDDARKVALFAELLEAAQAWWPAHTGFGPVKEVAQELDGLDATWMISSGWALDLFLGHVTRVHHDVDVVVAWADQLLLQAHMTARVALCHTAEGGAGAVARVHAPGMAAPSGPCPPRRTIYRFPANGSERRHMALPA